MNPDVLSPRPVRPHKRPLSDIEPECVPANKHPRLSPFPFPSPTPSTKDQPSRIPYPSRCPSSASSRPRSTSKRALEDLSSDCAPPNKHRRLQSQSPTPNDDQPSKAFRSTSAQPRPSSAKRGFGDFNPVCAPASNHRRLRSPTNSPIGAWLFEDSSPNLHPSRPPSNRPKSCPAAIDISIYTPASLATIKEISQQQYAESLGPGSGASRSSRPGTSHALYRGSLYNNFITIDYSGKQMPQDLREYTNTHILKQRESPQLGDDSVSKVIETAEELADSTEGPTTKLIRTAMFPFEHSDIGEGGNSPWNTTALPNNPEYEYDLAAPNPDVYLGYPNNQRSSWSYAQSNVINHPVARPYTQPARGNTFPFLMVEIKSEPAGGTLYIAENQAAGSGSYSVNALLWLLKEAGLSDSHSVEDKIAFTVTMSHRQAIFYIHWYSADDRRFYMSYLKSYSSMEPKDIRACNNTIKNIVDIALGARKTMVGNALQALFPFPGHWKQSRPASTAPSTPATSFTEDARPSKSQRRR